MQRKVTKPAAKIFCPLYIDMWPRPLYTKVHRTPRYSYRPQYSGNINSISKLKADILLASSGYLYTNKYVVVFFCNCKCNSIYYVTQSTLNSKPP